ncbi:hypothetical protein [Brachybacterium hainanense]|uniref:Tyr recombinase domain-containing protein n=1 Tax=Brachybacterium hainanense TaxID=1541174 RepID=A0ABV6RDZ9_9MICO
MAANPLAGVRLDDLTGVRRPERTRGGRTLSADAYEQTLVWLLEADPVTWLVSHKKGGWIWRPDTQVATSRAAVDQTLLQMTTGLRQTEARRVEWPMARVSADGILSIDVPAHVARGGHPRVVLVLDQRVAERLLKRRDAQDGAGYIVGTPTDPMKEWYRASCVKAVQSLYERMATSTKIKLFTTGRSHLWRTTLRSFYEGKVPEAVLNSQFGHSTEVARLDDTDASDLSGLSDAAGLRET